jgi:hypothetical protein
MYLIDFFWKSVAAMMLGLPVSLRSFAARRDSSTGRYDSGMNTRAGKVASARNVPNANTHRQLEVSPIKPEMGGENKGPVLVAVMNVAIAMPRWRGSLYTSAYKPGTIAIGPLATCAR